MARKAEWPTPSEAPTHTENAPSPTLTPPAASKGPDQFTDLLSQPLPADAAELVDSATERVIAETGSGLQLTEANLAGADLRGFNLRRSKLNRARLDGAKLDGADLTEATLICPMLERASMRGATLDKIYSHALAVVSSDWTDVRMRGALDCTGSLFHGVDLTRADLTGGNFAGSTFYQCDLTDADLSNCDLTGVTFNQCVMRGTKLDGALVSFVTFTRTNAEGMSLRGVSGTGLVLQVMIGLARVDLSGVRLPQARIRGGALVDASLAGAELIGLDMTDVAMSGCDLSGANLSEATLRSVSGERNVFHRARLGQASFLNCRMPGTDFRGATAENARFLRCVMPGSLLTSLDDHTGRSTFTASGMVIRDSDFSDADFSHSYLYMTFFTGDPVTGMLFDRAKFVGANLVQSTVSASLRDANMHRVLGSYSRWTRSDLSGVDMSAAEMHEATFVKVVLTGTNMAGVKAPVFLDRCRDLATATLDEEFRAFTGELGEVLGSRKRGST